MASWELSVKLHGEIHTVIASKSGPTFSVSVFFFFFNFWLSWNYLWLFKTILAHSMSLIFCIYNIGVFLFSSSLGSWMEMKFLSLTLMRKCTLRLSHILNPLPVTWFIFLLLLRRNTSVFVIEKSIFNNNSKYMIALFLLRQVT